MLLKLARACIVDPVQGHDRTVRDLFIRDGRIVVDPGEPPDETVDLGGNIVMAGGIDLHSHIAGGKVNLARLLMATGDSPVTPTAATTGRRYAEMGYTAVFEPAMVAANARHAHLELADVPYVDSGAYLVLGNDDLLLKLIAEDAGEAAVNDYVAWMVTATQSLAVKVVNAGGINAFKFNGRSLALDERGPHYGLTPRRILQVLTRAVGAVGLAHPLHVHGSNLGVAGNGAATLATIGAAEGVPIHLTHLQFHSYGAEGDRRFSSAAAEIAELVNASPSVTVDVGQIMFAQTVTASADTMAQYRNHSHASPRKWLAMDIECDAGCGIVPFRYRDRSFVNALQWQIGLELFLAIRDPWRIYLTTDHPNGAAFTAYPRLIRLLMDRDFREAERAKLPAAARAASVLGSMSREYTLGEIAIVTRAGPARILGLADRGHLSPGAVADVVVYAEQADREAMFARPLHSWKAGQRVLKDGVLLGRPEGDTIVARPRFDAAIERRIDRFMSDHLGLRAHQFRIADGELRGGRGPMVV